MLTTVATQSIQPAPLLISGQAEFDAIYEILHGVLSEAGKLLYPYLKSLDVCGEIALCRQMTISALQSRYENVT